MANIDPRGNAARDSRHQVGTTAVNAIKLLKSDHSQVEEWFTEFECTDDASRKEALAADLCKALAVHMRIEEEIFYPAFLAETADGTLHHRAVVEHESAKELIGKIRLSPGVGADGYLDARVKVLAEMIRHHISDEEGPGGMFDVAASSELDLNALGARLQQRKIELLDDFDTAQGYDAAAQPADGSGEWTR